MVFHTKTNKSKLYLLLVLYIVNLLPLSTTAANILVLDSQTYKTAIQQYEYLLVFYYSNDCQQCVKAAFTYYTLHSICYTQSKGNLANSSNALDADGKSNKYKDSGKEIDWNSAGLQFAQIVYKGNQQLFIKQSIQSVPQFILYHKTLKKIYKFPQISLTYSNIPTFIKWLQRIIKPSFTQLQTYQSFQQIQKSQKIPQKYILMDCSQKKIINKLLQSALYYQTLQLNYYCIKKSNLRDGRILLKQNKYLRYLTHCNIKQLQQQQEQQLQQHQILQHKRQKQNHKHKQRQCFNAIYNFKFRGVVRWSDQIINYLYNKNYSILVLIASNQSVSHQYLRNITKIKQNFDLNRNKQLLPIFTVADLHYNIQDTIRVKKFVGGYDIKGWPYPFPLLAYLHLNQKGQIIKYIYQLKYQDIAVTQYSIQQWLYKAMAGRLPRDSRGLNQTIDLQILNKQSHTIYKIYLSQLLYTLDEITQSSVTTKNPQVFVYVYWRTNWKMQLISLKLKKWWNQVNYTCHFFNYDLYDNDLPDDINIQNLPAFITYFNDGTHLINQDINNSSQIKNIVQNYYGKSTNTNINKNSNENTNTNTNKNTNSNVNANTNTNTNINTNTNSNTNTNTKAKTKTKTT